MVGYEPELTIEKDLERQKDPLVLTPRPLTRPYHLRCCSPYDYDGALATPLVQVFSVRVFNNFDDGKPCEIYGSIRALEGDRSRFYLYNRDPQDSETILEKGSLSLIGPDYHPIVPSLGAQLELCLYDRIRGVKVLGKNLDLDLVQDHDSYDRLMKHEFRGPYVNADVYYVIFQFAAYATLHFKLTKIGNGDSNCSKAASIYGSIVTGYENARRYCSRDVDVVKLETRVFDKPSNEPLLVLLGNPIKLSRKVVAVPAYSSVTIQVNLWDSNGKIAGGCLQFPAYDRGDQFLYIQTQYAHVEVRIQWKAAFFYLYRHRKMLLLKEKELSNGNEALQQKVFYDEEAISSTYDYRSIPHSPRHYRNRKVEIFTVFVDGLNQKISALCGAILIDDGGNRFSIYNRDDSSMEELSDINFASIEFNFRAIQNDQWAMFLFLRDPVNNLEVSKGCFGWSDCALESNGFHNKRLCSVVPGDDGFAVVHYQIFSSSYEAFVTVTLYRQDDTDSTVYLHGNLFGRYSDHDYSTSYQQKYYRSRLFNLPRNKAVEVKAGSEISLLRSIFAVPGDADLIIDVDLVICGIDGIGDFIRGMGEFEFDDKEPFYVQIEGQHYGIEICATFKETNYVLL